MGLIGPDRPKFRHERDHQDRLRDCLDRIQTLANDATVEPATATDSLNVLRREIDRQLESLREFESPARRAKQADLQTGGDDESRCDDELEITSLDALEEAAKRIGLELRRGQTTYKWWGHSECDYPIPAGFTEEDLGKCDHALVPTKLIHLGYEIGVCRRRDGREGFTLLWDFVDDNLVRTIGQDGGKLKQAYSTVMAIRQARQMGFQVSEHLQANGIVRLELLRL